MITIDSIHLDGYMNGSLKALTWTNIFKNPSSYFERNNVLKFEIILQNKFDK